MGKRGLQIVCGILAIIPVATGMIGLLGTSDPLYAGVPANVLLDTNLRFFAGVWLVLGLALLWVLPRIDRETALFRVLWAMVFAGGIGRLVSMLVLAVPPAPFIAFTVLELVGAPLIVWWHSRLATGKA
jgi:hypothetical protein